MSAAHPAAGDYPGRRLGLPPEGSGSVASWPRRIIALFVDWLSSSFVATFLVAVTGIPQEWLTLLVFFVQVSLFTGLVGGSFGQLALQVVIARMDGRPITILEAMLRTFLICLVIPPVVFNPDRRGLHDLAVRTIALRR